jgi:hypothetical protein
MQACGHLFSFQLRALVKCSQPLERIAETDVVQW